MKWRLAMAVCVVALMSGCSGSNSDDPVRSGPGPTPANSGDSSQESPDAAAAEETATTPTTSPLLSIEGDVEVPEGEEGELTIVVIGEPDVGSSTVPVIVRNRTPEPLANLEVTGTARDGAGALVGSGSSQGFSPELVQPGEWAVGYVFIDGAKLSKGTEFDLTATGSEPDEMLGSVDVQVVEVAFTKGQFGDQLVGIVENPTDTEVGGPVSVLAGCFDEQGTLTSTPNGFADSDPIPPGGTSSFSIDLFDEPCENWAIGASGYDF